MDFDTLCFKTVSEIDYLIILYEHIFGYSFSLVWGTDIKIINILSLTMNIMVK